MREPYYIFIAFILGFVVAQVTKFVLTLVKKENRGRKWSVRELWRELTRSGGMPSGHAAAMSGATMVALLSTISSNALGTWTEGYDLGGSGATAFFVLLCVDAIVLYDAIHVRWAVGEQGKALNKLLEKNGQPTVRVVEGHTLRQVIVGIALGVVVGWLMLFVAEKLGAPMSWYGG